MSFHYYILGLVGFILTFQPAHAQNNISGTVQQEDNEEPIAGAKIYIADVNRGTYADFDGKFELKNIKRGSYYVEVSAIGFKSVTRRITVQNNTQVDFKLQSSVTELSDVVVTGVGRSTERKRSPIAIQSLDEDVLKHNSATNLIDGLKDVPRGSTRLRPGPPFPNP